MNSGEISKMAQTHGFKPTKSLDARGLFCPEPVFRTKVEMEGLSVGEVLQVVADDPAAEEDISRWAKRSGQQLLLLKPEGKDLYFYLRKQK